MFPRSEEKHTIVYNNFVTLKITCLFSMKELFFAFYKFIHSILLVLHEALPQMTWIPSKEENTEAITFLLCKINNSSTAAQIQRHTDI